MQTYVLRYAGKIWPLAFRLSMSLRVIATDTYRSDTCINDPLSIWYRFRDKWRFRSLAVFTLKFVTVVGLEKWNSSRYQMVKNLDNVCNRLHPNHNVTRTDGQTDG